MAAISAGIESTAATYSFKLVPAECVLCKPKLVPMTMWSEASRDCVLLCFAASCTVT